MTLVLAGGTVVAALDPPVVLDADVVVEGDRIAAIVERRPGVAAAPPAGAAPATASGAAHDEAPTADGPITRRDCAGCLVIPGNVCAHTHAYSALARGMPYRLEAPRTFLDVLRRVWWRLDRALDLDLVTASARVAAMEALLAGTTTLVDHHASPNAIDGSLDAITDAFAVLGVRSILCYEVSDRDGPERASAGIRENERFVARVGRGGLPLARAMVGAHASFTLSDATLEACAGLARDTQTGVHVHVAEDAVDEVDAERAHGMRVMPRLARTGALTDRALLAHCVHVDDDEAAAIRAAGATVAHNPRSNMNNAVGRAPLGRLGDRVALGTDGIGADMFEESRAGYLRAREDGLEPPAAWPLARLAEGGHLAGRLFGEAGLGSIAVGAPADLAVLEYPAPVPVTADTLAGHWVFGLSARTVRDVVAAGRLVVADRRLTLVDQDALAAEAREQARRLWARLEAVAVHPFDPRAVAVR